MRPRRARRAPAEHPAPDPKPADNNTETWPLGQAVSTQYIETDEKGQAKALAKLDVGVYRAIFETQDRLGKRVKAIHTLTVLDPLAKRLSIRLPQIAAGEKHSVEPGETYRLVWGTGYNLSLIHI